MIKTQIMGRKSPASYLVASFPRSSMGSLLPLPPSFQSPGFSIFIFLNPKHSFPCPPSHFLHPCKKSRPSKQVRRLSAQSVSPCSASVHKIYAKKTRLLVPCPLPLPAVHWRLPAQEVALIFEKKMQRFSCSLNPLHGGQNHK